MTALSKPVTREIPRERVPNASRALVVTILDYGIQFRGKGRQRYNTLTWAQIVARLDDLRKDLQ